MRQEDYRFILGDLQKEPSINVCSVGFYEFCSCSLIQGLQSFIMEKELCYLSMQELMVKMLNATGQLCRVQVE